MRVYQNLLNRLDQFVMREGTGLILVLEQEFHAGSGTASGVELFYKKISET